MMKQKPVFKKKEIVIEYPNSTINFGAEEKQIVVEIAYIGQEVTKFKVGDKILVIFKPDAIGRKFNFMGQDLYRFDGEDSGSIICQVIEENV